MQANAGNMSTGAQVTMSAVIGGTAEKLGGGKFANGAVTGAYVMMFNHLMDDGKGNTTQLNDDSKHNNENVNSTEANENNPILGGVGAFVTSGADVINNGVMVPILNNLESMPNNFIIDKDIALIGKVTKYSSFIKWAGWAGTATSVVAVELDVRNGVISRQHGNIEQVSNGIGAIPVIGTAWTAGWHLGKCCGPSRWFK
jgi:hypothetical protein